MRPNPPRPFFRVSIPASLFVLVALVLLIWLGSWQFGRYLEKVDLEESAQERTKKDAVQLASANGLSGLSLRRILPLGRFENGSQVIKHRIRNGKPGYWIVRPFRFKDGSRVLVNIGWYPKAKSEAFAKTLDAPKPGWTALVHVLDRNIADSKTRSSSCSECVWRSFDVVGMNKKFLDKDSMMVLVAGDNAANGQYPSASFNHVISPYMTSEKHLGYALTWFGLAIGLVMLFLGAGLGYLGRK